MENENVSKMAGVLLAGGKMLSTHCPECKSPLFEHGGKIMCSVCNCEVQVKGEAKKLAEAKRGKSSPSDIERVLLEKRDKLVAQLEKETSPRAMSEILESMRLILVVLEKIRTR